jgi:hypothetical protein
MPYIPFTPAPPVIVEAGAVQGYTNGFFYSPSYNLELNKIAFEINALQFQFSPLAAQTEVGSPAASLSAVAINSGIIAENVADIHLELKKLNLSISGVSNSIDTSTKGLANISTHMAKQTVIQTMAVNNDIKKAEFEKQVTNTAQEAAGVPKTVVTPQALVARVEEVITDVTTTNALISATALVQETVANAATTAFTTTATWIAESAFGVYVQEAFGKVEVAVIGLFSDAKAKVAADKLQARLQKLKAGATS